MAGESRDAKKLAAAAEHDAAAVEAARRVETAAEEAGAFFRRCESELGVLLGQARDHAAGQGGHGRRLARLATEIEDALLQARQGAHEAHYGQ